MNNTVLLTVRTDKKLKEAAQKVAREMGVPLSAIVNNQLRRVVEDRELIISVPLVGATKARRQIEKIANDENAKNWSGPFTSARAVRAHLDSLKA